ncbi:hypothetical protein HY628_00020 [Candidatus Uhrbacteria bacterium]|nr:hypothetical protein [Candidatus Uhrbacteria bacterium]
MDQAPAQTQLSEKPKRGNPWYLVAFFLGLAVGILGMVFTRSDTKEEPGVSPQQTSEERPLPEPREASLSQTQPPPSEKNQEVDSPPEEVIDRTALTIAWSPELIPFSTTGLADENYFDVYQVGTVEAPASLRGNRLLLIERQVAFGFLHYRVLDDPKKIKLVFLTNLSNIMDPEDEPYFIKTTLYDIPDLRLPNEVTLTVQGKEVKFFAERFSPAVLFVTFINRLSSSAPGQLKADLVHPTYGTLYKDLDFGSFIFRLPDHTLKLYHLEYPMPTTTFAREYAGGLEGAPLTLRLNDGTTLTDEYTLDAPWLCPPRKYNIYQATEGDSDDRFKEGGRLSNEILFYEPRQTDDPLYQDIYNQIYWRAATAISYQEFLAEHPVILVSDRLGRWQILTKVKFYPALETECGYFNSVL